MLGKRGAAVDQKDRKPLPAAAPSSSVHGFTLLVTLSPALHAASKCDIDIDHGVLGNNSAGHQGNPTAQESLYGT